MKYRIIVTFVASLLLIFPLNLFSQIFENSGIKIEVAYPNLKERLPQKQAESLGIAAIELTITNQTNENIVVNQKSILSKNVAKNPIIVANNMYENSPFTIQMNHSLILLLIGVLIRINQNFALTVFNSVLLARLTFAAMLGSGFLLNKMLHHYVFISELFKSYQFELYVPDIEIPYFCGFYNEKYTWEHSIQPLQSRKIIVLVDKKRKRFMFDVFKNNDNSELQRIRFEITL